MTADWSRIARRMRHLWFPAQKRVVEWMGDTKLHRIGRDLIASPELEAMQPHLRPGDILLARKNWYLSNIGLPGFWTHAGLYIGTPESIETLSSRPDVARFIADGTGRGHSLTDYLRNRFPDAWTHYVRGRRGKPYCIVEAVSEGVRAATLQQCRGDYLAVLRPRLSAVAKAQAIIAAFGHLGKPYDFDFDFASSHALVCTELVWRCYLPAERKEGLHFQLVDIAGWQMLPANDIARLYATQRNLPDRQLDFIYFLDASEKQQRSFVANEAAFLRSHKRSKWDLVQK